MLKNAPVVLIFAALAAASRADTPRPAGAALGQRLLAAGPVELEADPALHAFVHKTAERAIAQHCAGCHGMDLKGARPGVPDLTDYDTLWNTGALEEIDATQVMSLQQTLLWGIRNQDCPDTERKKRYGACPDTRYSRMPGYGKEGVFDAAQIADLAEYVLQLGKQGADTAAAARGKALYAQGCAECHGADGFGYGPYGGPNLTDEVWLFGGGRVGIINTIANGPGPDGAGGYCPPWGRTLEAVTIKALAVYIHGKANEED